MNFKKYNYKYYGKNIASSVIAFGLGAMLSAFCPTGLLFFISAVIIVALGCMLKL